MPSTQVALQVQDSSMHDSQTHARSAQFSSCLPVTMTDSLACDATAQVNTNNTACGQSMNAAETHMGSDHSASDSERTLTPARVEVDSERSRSRSRSPPIRLVAATHAQKTTLIKQHLDAGFPLECSFVALMQS